MYWRFSAKGVPDSGWNRNVNIDIWVTNTSTNQQTMIYSNSVPPEWTDYSGDIAPLIAGRYVVNAFLGRNNAPNDAFMLDDINIDVAPVTEACQVLIPLTTATTTPIPSPTVSGMPGPNLIENCGFEQGPKYWDWQRQLGPDHQWHEQSYVIYGLNNYSHAEWNSQNPGVKQGFFWTGGIAYVTFESDSDYNVYLRNRATGIIYPVASGQYPYQGWQLRQGAANIPAGAYDISLHQLSSSVFSQYDNIAVTAGNYSRCSAGANVTPTPHPTATQQDTPTQFPTSTQRATSTAAPGYPTSTPIPSFTPWPTYTQMPSPQPTLTSRPYSTFTPYPTYTSRPTYTPQPTYTPNAQGTIEPSITPSATVPPQPPPDYYTDCQRPDTGDAAGWIEYNRCVMLSFFTWSPKAGATLVAMPTLMSDKEPFGTVNEFKQAGEGVKGLVDSYDWEHTGIDGTSDNPDIGAFMPDGNNPWFTGRITFTQGTGTGISKTCTAAITSLLGQHLSAGYCWLVNFLKAKGITPWLQLLVDIAALSFLGSYLIRKWIDAGSGSH